MNSNNKSDTKICSVSYVTIQPPEPYTKQEMKAILEYSLRRLNTQNGLNPNHVGDFALAVQTILMLEKEIEKTDDKDKESR